MDLPSKSMNLRSKSMDWFLYDNGVRHEKVNGLIGNHWLIERSTSNGNQAIIPAHRWLAYPSSSAVDHTLLF